MQDIGDSLPTVNVEADLTPANATRKILIVAGDPLLAALLGGLVELARFEAAFSRPQERAHDALARVKPLAAILVEANDDFVESDLFLARARRGNVEVLLFGSAALIRARREWATAQQVKTFQLPDDVERLQASLDHLRNGANADARGHVVRGGSRRAAHTERDQEGTLIFDDGKGTRWSVYDRRGNDRRQSAVDRQFVSSTGEVWHCAMSEEEAASTTVASLTEQLARAEPLKE